MATTADKKILHGHGSNGISDSIDRPVENGVLEIEEELDDDDANGDDRASLLLTSRGNQKRQDVSNSGSSGGSGSSSSTGWLCRRLGVLAVVVGLAIFLLDWTSIVSFYEEEGQSEEAGIMEWLQQAGGGGVGKKKKKKTNQLELARALHGNVSEALHRLREEVLRPDYGDSVDSVFAKDSIMQAIHVPSTRALTRLKRKLWLKVLQANVNSKESSSRFTWINAGHSTSAGHGNLFPQTSPVQLERAAAAVFAAAHIEFRAKNYAMGGYASHPELALCAEAIYGMTDLDLLSWDFGMTDGAQSMDSYHFWVQRAAIHPQFPIVWNNGDPKQRPFQVHPHYDNAGIATLAMVGWDDLRHRFPNSKKVKPEDLPPAVAWYMCDDYPEADECADHKWATKPDCETTKYQSSWHNGWKDHLFIGRVQAVFICEMLLEVLAEAAQLDKDNNGGGGEQEQQRRQVQSPDTAPLVTNSTRQRPTAVDLDTWNRNEVKVPPALSMSFWNKLLKWEREDADLFAASPIHPDTVDAPLYGNALKSRAYCHSALLPSQARFDGLVMAHGEKTPPGQYEYGGLYTDYDMGPCTEQDIGELEHDRHPKSPNCPADDLESSPFQVMYDPGLRQICPPPALFETDYPESFIIRRSFGVVGGAVPNNHEWAASNHAHATSNTASSFESPRIDALMIQLCTKQCPWGKCPGNWVLADEIGPQRNISVWVNDEEVEEAIPSQRNCYFLMRNKKSQQQERTHLFEAPSSVQVTIHIQVHHALRFLVTSMIVLTVPDANTVQAIPTRDETKL